MSSNNRPSSSSGHRTGAVSRVRRPYDRHQVPAALLHPHHGRARNHHQGMCNICSYNQEAHEPQVPVYHRHFSSLRLRQMTGAEAENKRYLCPSCKSFHLPYPDPENRIKVVVSDSTLHEFLLPQHPAGPSTAISCTPTTSPFRDETSRPCPWRTSSTTLTQRSTDQWTS